VKHILYMKLLKVKNAMALRMRRLCNHQ